MNNALSQARWLLLLGLCAVTSVWADATPPPTDPPKEERPVEILQGFDRLSRESRTCVSCHREKTPSIYHQWGASKHYRANVGCYECHQASTSDKDAIMHKEFVISVVVSPRDCAQCHEKEAAQFERSHHAAAGNILGSLDNRLAEVVEGMPMLDGTSAVTTVGCAGCHGSIVRVNSDGSLKPSSWPNTGIGRINPDGSRGACSACHLRHNFSAAQARDPDNCGRCHLGPDHPQKEIYEESAHGVAFRAHRDEMNLDSSKWIVGEDYTAAPTCATCHMSATKDLPVTHDVGDRISWNLRAPVSFHIDEKELAKGKQVKPWRERRKDMKNVCMNCHGRNVVDAHYEQFDAVVLTYNEKFAKPGLKLMKALYANGLLDKVKFNEDVEWTWFYLWHHEGRRARHGAAMFSPDYTHWNGMFEVANRFYIHMVPEIQARIDKARAEGKTEAADAVQKVLDEVLSSAPHRWFQGGEPPPFWRPDQTDDHGFQLQKTASP